MRQSIQYQDYVKGLMNSYFTRLICDQDDPPSYRIIHAINTEPDVTGRCLTELMVTDKIKANNEQALLWLKANMLSYEQWKTEQLNNHKENRDKLKKMFELYSEVSVMKEKKIIDPIEQAKITARWKRMFKVDFFL